MITQEKLKNNTSIRMSHRRPIYGVGINDADYLTTTLVQGKKRMCPYYQTWAGMLKRVYCKYNLIDNPQYMVCSVADEWHIFSKFKEWMIKQDWEGRHLDKDILVTGNKIYSSETCIFVPHAINLLVGPRARRKSKYPVGVSYRKRVDRFESSCSRGCGKTAYIGNFSDPIEAHEKYCLYKSYVVREAAVGLDIKLKEALLRIANEIEMGVYYQHAS